jgi:hypothetical protein
MSASEHDADRNFNCEIASMITTTTSVCISASRQRTDTSWRTANATYCAKFGPPSPAMTKSII